MRLVGKQAIRGSLTLFRSELQYREDLWRKAAPDKKTLWLEKDPVISTAYELFRYLEKFFSGYKYNGE